IVVEAKRMHSRHVLEDSPVVAELGRAPARMFLVAAILGSQCEVVYELIPSQAVVAAHCVHKVLPKRDLHCATFSFFKSATWSDIDLRAPDSGRFFAALRIRSNAEALSKM